MNDSQQKPISAFDEICHLTIETMRKMDMETLLELKDQATLEFNRAKLTKACLETALSVKAAERKMAANQPDPDQPTLLDD